MKNEKTSEIKKFKKIKDSRSILRTACVLAVFVCIMCVMMSHISFGATLSFDDEGNLVYVAYDGVTTANIRYRTIGWVLKRYDAPINAKGQQYIIIQKRSGGNSYTDPDDPSVKYYVFTSDSKEILTAIEKVSKDWKKQLVNYGGTIYIDSVMTIVENGVEKGKVNSKGEMSGEVYITYEGLAGARAWPNPPILKQHFDIEVEYKQQVSYGTKSVTYEKKSITYDSAVTHSTSIGSNNLGDEIYDIGVAIPGGERLYAQGVASMYQYQVKMSKIDGTLNVPVKVSTVYNITWKGYDGTSKKEKKKVDRYYMVAKKFSYYEYSGASVYVLTKHSIKNQAINNGVSFVNYSLPEVYIDYKKYGGINSHIKAESMYEVNTKQVNLSSNDYIKPNIPDEDYSETANNKVSNLYVHNDSVSIGGIEVSSDKEYKLQAKSPIYFEPETVISDIVDVYIKEYCRNGSYNSTDEFVYKCADKNKSYSSSISSINVLTPVMAEMKVVCENEDKNAQNVENEIYPGGIVWIDARTYDQYDNYKGYNMCDLNRYIKKKDIKFGCDVYVGQKKYLANTWIEMGMEEQFEIAQDTLEGDYSVEIRSYAINYKYGDDGETHTNGKKRLYYASAESLIHVKEREKEKEEEKFKIIYSVVGTH